MVLFIVSVLPIETIKNFRQKPCRDPNPVTFEYKSRSLPSYKLTCIGHCCTSYLDYMVPK